MPGTTPTYGLRYQVVNDPPDGALLGAQLAADVEAQIVRLDGRIDSRIFIAAKAADGVPVNNSTTRVPDADLFISVAANAGYVVEGWLTWNSGTVPDIQFGFTGPAGATLAWSLISGPTTFAGPSAAATEVDYGVLSGALGVGHARAGIGAAFSGQILGNLKTVGTAGTLTLTMAQSVANVSNTLLLAGSWIKLTRYV